MGWITGAAVSTWVPPRARRAAAPARGWVGSGSGTALGPRWSADSSGALDLGAHATGVTPHSGLVAARGRRLGRYRLIERLGRGRQADVWRALQTDPVVEEVALKVLTGSARDPRRRAQLRREAERGARLAGPALLPTYEFGEADGAVFMAMPLIVGDTLAGVIAQRRESRAGRPVAGAHRLAVAPERVYTRDAVAVLARVARAADGAHAARVAHRDIKPGNILVGRDHRDPGGVFLCDFGLARDLDVATPAQLRDGAGSPLYMAPERLLRHTADEVRGDVYALGVTLCEALTLATPVTVPDDLPQALWVSYLVSTEPARPSDLWPAIPPGLEAVILRATARDPARRYSTAGRLADELERWLG